MMARCLRDKVPKGDYVIRASVLDRLTDNKMYYKIIEYGERVKEQRLVEKEKLKREQEEEINKLAESEINQLFDDQKENYESQPYSPETQAKQAKDNEFKAAINKPLFEPGDEREDDHSQDGDDDVDKKKVKWDAGVVDNNRSKFIRKQGTLVQLEMKRDELKQAGNVGLLSNALRKTKIGFDFEEFNNLYKGMETEKVWIDFGKANTNVHRYNALTSHSELNFEGHKLYYMLPPSMDLIPSNIILFELLFLSSKSTCKDEVKAWGAFPIVNGDFEISTGKFKVPMLFGDIDFSTNKFKDIE